MAQVRALQKVGGKAIEVAINASKGIVVRAQGRPAEIVAYAAAAAVVLVGAAVAAGIYYSIKGVEAPVRPEAESPAV
jgi:hypothetical protein